jgi:hypothetical protein
MMLFVVLLGLLQSPSTAQELTAVLSSELSPYVEALEGLRTVWDRPIHQVHLEDGQVPQLPSETRIVVTFGGQAALASYPPNVVVIYCLSPGVTLEKRGHQNRAIKITMIPSANEVIKKMKVVQPNLRRLGVFWVSASQEPFLHLLETAARQWDIQVVTKRLGGVADLPNGLRSILRDGVDGLWLPPDPAIINPRSFGIFREFSYANDVPFYVPSSGLLEKGAIASISCGFDDVGRTAGEVALQVLLGDQLPIVVYPKRVTFCVNLKGALETDLAIDLEALARNGGEVKE